MKIYNVFILTAALSVVGCDSYFDVDVDKAQVISDVVFNDNANARSAIAGIYSAMATSSLFGGGPTGVTMLAGLSADEFTNLLGVTNYVMFEENDILAESEMVYTLWSDAYRVVYQVNDVLEELDGNVNVDVVLNKQLSGEALFIRALAYYYLVNLFGDVPLILTTRYQDNARASRVKASLVYDQIVQDLTQAQKLLNDEYPELERVRPNKYAATALLARVHLTLGEWEKAKGHASVVISNSTMYKLNSNLSSVFKRQSEETIFEIASDNSANTREGSAFIIGDGVGESSVELSDSLLNSFEPNDLRKASWIGIYVDAESGLEIKFPFKYTSTYYSSPPIENLLVIRLAEMFLIRAEANANLQLLDEGISDIDSIRVRAGLAPILEDQPTLTLDDLFQFIWHERRVEFFAEWGHRWFDLKRTGLAQQILETKPEWSSDDVLYPIPSKEFMRNPKLGLQNDGY